MQIQLILGNSGAGKDYITEKFFPNHYVYKLNQPFKDIFEADHNLAVGSCNDKALRSITLLSGPLEGLALGAAMAQAFTESESEDSSRYGFKFKDLTLQKFKEFLATTDHKAIVINDLRKLDEAIAVLDSEATTLASLLVVNRYATGLESDCHLHQLIDLFQPTILENHYTC
jgi:hypothetical protein